MPTIPVIRADAYQYSLPSERIAQFPLPDRDASKLLVWDKGNLSEDSFSGIARHLPLRSLMVFNTTRVIHARLFFRKQSGALIELFCLEPLDPGTDLSQAYAQQGEVRWRCLIGNARRWHQEDLQLRVMVNKQLTRLTASGKQPLGDGTFALTFTWESRGVSFGEILEAAGKIPLPPYIRREAIESDQIRYQTVFARHNGSVAAPTAGLHFTENSFTSLMETGISTEQITLHVGLGTFRQVTTTTVNEHDMHKESFLVSLNTLENLRRRLNDPLVAVGTTTVRTLESLYWFGVRLIHDREGIETPLPQWYPYDPATASNISVAQALDTLIRWLKKHNLDTLSGSTQLMIVPGYRYRIVTGMVTNFHQPGSTLLLLVAAFIGDAWKSVYRYALDHQFRFLSYGDACLFLRK